MSTTTSTKKYSHQRIGKTPANNASSTRKPAAATGTSPSVRTFTLLRVDYAQATEAYLGGGGSADHTLSPQPTTLGHVDRAYVLFGGGKNSTILESTSSSSWPATATLHALARKVYAARLQLKADAFVSLLEVNVQEVVLVVAAGNTGFPSHQIPPPYPQLQPTAYQYASKYSFLMAVLSLAGSADLLVVPLPAAAFQRPGAKCFELTASPAKVQEEKEKEKVIPSTASGDASKQQPKVTRKKRTLTSQNFACHQRPYHLISGSGGGSSTASASLDCGAYRILLVKPPSGWLLLLNLSGCNSGESSSTSVTPALLTANQYVALGGSCGIVAATTSSTSTSRFNTKLVRDTNKSGARFGTGNHHHHHHQASQQKKGHLPWLLPAVGDGVLVQYGAILFGGGGDKFRGVRGGGRGVQTGQRASGRHFVFIGEFASPVVSFSRIQTRLNLAASLEALSKHLAAAGNSIEENAEEEEADGGDAEKAAAAAALEVAWPALPKLVNIVSIGGGKTDEAAKKQLKEKKLVKIAEDAAAESAEEQAAAQKPPLLTNQDEAPFLLHLQKAANSTVDDSAGN